MDHGHEGHDMAKCKMNMLWNTDIIDTCIVFRRWHIHSYSGFLGACIAIVLIGIFYEYLRLFQRKLDYRIALSLQKGKTREGRDNLRGSRTQSPEGNSDELGLLTGTKVLNTSMTGTRVPAISRALRAVIYGATVFLSFFLMLVFMTYNAYLIAATVIGATFGHYIFGATMNTDAILSDGTGGKGMACH